MAQHSVHCVELVIEKATNDRFTAMAALLHDASEAYLSDIIRPVKRSLISTELRQIETRLDQCVAQRFDIAPANWMSSTVKWADNGMLKNEHEQLFDATKAWECDHVDVRRLHIPAWSPTEAEHNFLCLYHELEHR